MSTPRDEGWTPLQSARLARDFPRGVVHFFARWGAKEYNSNGDPAERCTRRTRVKRAPVRRPRVASDEQTPNGSRAASAGRAPLSSTRTLPIRQAGRIAIHAELR